MTALLPLLPVREPSSKAALPLRQAVFSFRRHPNKGVALGELGRREEEAIFYGHTRTMKSMISTSVGLCQEAVTKPFNASAYLTTNQIPAKLTLAATALNVAVPAAR
jgi:hypothetical protein